MSTTGSTGAAGSTSMPSPVTVPSTIRVSVDSSTGVLPLAPDGLSPTSGLYPFSTRAEFSKSHAESATTPCTASVPPGTNVNPPAAPAAAPAVPPAIAPAPTPIPAPATAPIDAPAVGPAASAIK